MNVKVAEAQRLIIGPIVLLAGALLAMADADGLGPAKHRAIAELALCLTLAVLGLLLAPSRVAP